jgi:hypothetical protein|tara:strand:- start:395 stop:529 length:135 start_codon:yes stop_codon:yes gene_type:complete
MTYTYKLIEKDKITTIITTVDDDENVQVEEYIEILEEQELDKYN